MDAMCEFYFFCQLITLIPTAQEFAGTAQITVMLTRFLRAGKSHGLSAPDANFIASDFHRPLSLVFAS